MLMDKLGRRTLMITGTRRAVCFHRAIPWFFVAELFAQGPRSAAVSVSTLVNWSANTLVGFTFPHLQTAIGVYCFVPFAVMLFGFLVFTILFVPETKGKRIEDITLLFKAPEDQDESRENSRTDEEKS
nr:hypothetical protein BaRGS_006571 [Batillaria attramentaria]